MKHDNQFIQEFDKYWFSKQLNQHERKFKKMEIKTAVF